MHVKYSSTHFKEVKRHGTYCNEEWDTSLVLTMPQKIVHTNNQHDGIWKEIQKWLQNNGTQDFMILLKGPISISIWNFHLPPCNFPSHICKGHLSHHFGQRNSAKQMSRTTCSPSPHCSVGQQSELPWRLSNWWFTSSESCLCYFHFTVKHYIFAVTERWKDYCFCQKNGILAYSTVLRILAETKLQVSTSLIYLRLWNMWTSW